MVRGWNKLSTRRDRLHALHELLRDASIASLHPRCEEVLRQEPLIRLYDETRSDPDLERLLRAAQAPPLIEVEPTSTTRTPPQR